MSTDTSRDQPRKLFLLSAGYNGTSGKAYLKLLDPRRQEIVIWNDPTGHQPFCYSRESVEKLKQDERLTQAGAIGFLRENKFDLMEDKPIEVTKIVASDPLAVGGRAGSIRELVEAWEADIPYHLNYIYDRGLVCGMPYRVQRNDLIPLVADRKRIDSIVEELFAEEPDEERREIRNWMLLLEADQPEIKHVSLDIEVVSPVSTRVPSPGRAEDPVVSVALRGSDGLKKVLMLKRDLGGELLSGLPFTVQLYENEKDLLKETFNTIESYPIVATFNGDDFDLPYLRNRAERVGVERSAVPVLVGRQGASLKRGIHLDLYRLFFNKSMQIYAFNNAYRENTLEAVGQGILGRGKVEIEKPIAQLNLRELACYNFGDAELVHSLLSYHNDLVLRLLVVLCRISKLTIEDVCRQGVSGWIKNLLFYEHRARGYLIPRSEDILKVKDVTSTKAIIEGKKYRGAIVVKPVPGMYFDVTVLDFASLYPSALKEWNLSYETVRCPHLDCRGNRVPETSHWICTKRKGLESLLVGSLRNIRVAWYKPKSSDEHLPEETRTWYSVVQRALKVFLNASVPYEEEVVLQDPEGNVRLVPIGEFAEECIRSNGVHFDGINYVARPLRGWKALCTHPETRETHFADISWVTKHKLGREKILQVDLSSGRRASVTSSHSLLAVSSNGLQIRSIDTEDLKPGDKVLVPVKLPLVQGRKPLINLVQELHRLDDSLIGDVCLFFKTGWPLDMRRNLVRLLEHLSEKRVAQERELAQEVGVSRRTIKRYIRELRGVSYVGIARDGYQLAEKGVRYLALERELACALERRKGRAGYYHISLRDLRKVIELFDEEYAKGWTVGLYGRGKTRHRLPVTIQVTEELARLVGYYVAEGHAVKFRNARGGMSYRVILTNVDPMIQRDIESCFKRCLGSRPRLEKDRKNLTVDSKLVYLLFVEVLRAGRLAVEKQIPDCIMGSSRGIKLAFLEAYYRGDGTSRGSEIKLTSKNPRLINQLALLLMQLGIKGLYFSKDSGVWRLWIRAPLPFAGRVSRRRNYTEIVPGAYVRPLARALNRYTYVLQDGKNISRERAIELVNLSNGTLGCAVELRMLLEGDVVLDEVKRVSPCETNCQYVYDLSINGAENFVGGFGLVCLHNSYGVFGARIFPLYCPPVAESTAAIGRHAFSRAIEKARELGVKVIYGDTDSIFLETDKNLVRMLIDWAARNLRLDLEIDKVYRYVVFSTRKKNYLGVTTSNVVDVKGLTGKKRHVPIFIKKAFDDMVEKLRNVRTPEDLAEARREIENILRDWYHKLNHREFSLEDVSFHVMMSRAPERYVKTTPQHVKAARKLRDQGLSVSAGDIISFVKTRGREGVQPLQLARKEDVDVDKYMEYLESTFDQVLDTLGLNFKSIKGISSLEDFF